MSYEFSLSLFYLLCTYTLYVSLQFLALYFLFFGVDWFLLFCIVRYYEGLQKCFGLYSENAQFSADEIDRLEALYKSLAQQQKWSSAVKVAYFIDFFFPSSLFRMKTLWLARFAVLFTLFLVLFFHCYAENSYPLSFKTIYILFDFRVHCHFSVQWWLYIFLKSSMDILVLFKQWWWMLWLL